MFIKNPDNYGFQKAKNDQLGCVNNQDQDMTRFVSKL